MRLQFSIWICPLIFGLIAFAQEERVSVNRSLVPLEAASVKDFVPQGWVIEEQVSGDLNSDLVPDVALKLIQEGWDDGENGKNDGQRALILLFRDKHGRLHRAAIADRLLPCARGCGGAFYGVVKTPAAVQIRKGILVVSYDGGSRNLYKYTLRFRFEPTSNSFELIGMDFTDYDRLTGEEIRESTNYLTRQKITTRLQYSRRTGKPAVKSSSRTKVTNNHMTIEQVDHENI